MRREINKCRIGRKYDDGDGTNGGDGSRKTAPYKKKKTIKRIRMTIRKKNKNMKKEEGMVMGMGIMVVMVVVKHLLT